MVSGLLYKWEDSPALSHHCGFCERPLSHPGARASCFGTHSEPCFRFHQAMFMRLRSHTCHYCRTIDEAHDRRHKKIAGQIRDVYDSCGVDWTIIPPEDEEHGRATAYGTGLAAHSEADHDLTPEDTPPSKRERKNAKCLARAASRTRVITREEVLHVDAVLHSAEGVSNGDSNGPSNTDELEEIERHLKYNAHVYNTQSDRHGLKKFARLPDVDVDFDAEMERIFDVFHITELLQRNTRNRGLQGKELKTFQGLVDDLKKAVVDDLVAVKRDTLEIRMRRAGYLRYANKTAHNIVEDRYTDKDWKTGERHLPNTSSSSGIDSQDEESNSSQSPLAENSPPLPPAVFQHGPDRRHLEKIHKRVTGDDGLGQKVIEPYHTPLVPMPATPVSRLRAVQLKVVPNNAVLTPTASASKKTGQATWETVLSGKKPKPPSVKPAWGMTAAGRPVAASPSPVNPWGFEICEIPDLRGYIGAVVQPPEASTVTTSSGPDGFVEAGDTAVDGNADDETTDGHAIVSQKKAKKHEREARRKAKKAGLQQQISDTVAGIPNDEELNSTHDTALTADDGGTFDLPNKDESSRALAPDGVLVDTVVETVSSPVADVLELDLAEEQSPAPLHVTNNSKHVNWVKFQRQFMVDQLTIPFLPSSMVCSHSNTCVYEANDVPDCPFHPPHCSCVDPLADLCFLTYPSNSIASSGPYNRIHGEKVLALYQQDEHFGGRVMLVDNDMINYFLIDPTDRRKKHNESLVPKRLATEYADFADGYNPGPLMEQEKLFERLWNKNNIIKRQISTKMLTEFQKKHLPGNSPVMCYCQEKIPKDGLPKQVVECAYRFCTMRYFHKSCIKKLGVNKVSRWYCTRCAQTMETTAYQLLREMGYDDVPDEGEDLMNRTMEVLRENEDISEDWLNKMRKSLEMMGPAARVGRMKTILRTGL